jgi:hypothetical protein
MCCQSSEGPVVAIRGVGRKRRVCDMGDDQSILSQKVYSTIQNPGGGVPTPLQEFNLFD